MDAEKINKRKRGPIKNLNGQVFNRLTVLGLTEVYKGSARWLCRCVCGKFTTVQGSYLKSGHTTSCGCKQLEGGACRKLPFSNTPEMNSYKSAKGRCQNPSNKSYPRYGGRGIEFRFRSFEEFYAALGPRPEGYSLDRIDNNGHYEVGNIRWATPSEQSRNRRRQHWLVLHGERKTLAEWESIVGIKQLCLKDRKKRGWCDECSLTIPSGGGRCIHLPDNRIYGCKEEGCEGKHRSNGYCSKHLSRWQKQNRKIRH